MILLKHAKRGHDAAPAAAQMTPPPPDSGPAEDAGDCSRGCGGVNFGPQNQTPPAPAPDPWNGNGGGGVHCCHPDGTGIPNGRRAR